MSSNPLMIPKEEMDRLKALIGERDAKIERLKALLIRAADALNKVSRCFLVEDATVDWELIAELREAAQ